jgi:hypothetical protein
MAGEIRVLEEETKRKKVNKDLKINKFDEIRTSW